MWTLHLQLVEREAKREEAGGSGGGKTRPPAPPTAPRRWSGGVAGEDREQRRGRQGDIRVPSRAALSLGGCLGGSSAPAVSRLALRTLGSGKLRAWPGAGVGAGKSRENSHRAQRGVPGAPEAALSTETPPHPLVLGPSIRSLSTWGPVCRVSRGPVWMLTGTARGAGGSGPSSTAAFSCQPGPTVLSSHIQLVFPFRSPAPMPVEQ